MESAEYMKLLEESVRGQTLLFKIPTTELFAENYQKALRDANCLGENEEMLIDRYKDALASGLIDIQILCKALSSASVAE